MSSELTTNLVAIMNSLRIALLLLLPLYGITFALVNAAREYGVAWTAELLNFYPKSVIEKPLLMITILPIMVIVKLLHPFILFVGIVVALVVYIAFLLEEIEEVDETSIERDLKGVVIKRNKKNQPKHKVRLEKITSEKEYVENGEIDVDTDVEWKWDVKKVKKAGKTVQVSYGNKSLLNSSKEDRVEHVNSSIDRPANTPSSEENFAPLPEIIPDEKLEDIVENLKTPKNKKKPEDVVIKDAGASMIDSITNVKFYRKPLIEHDEEYTIFNMDSQEKYKSISGELLQQLLDYTGKWDESFNNHDMYFVSGIDPYNEHELTTELVTFIKDVLKMDDEVQLRWVYRTPL